MFNFVLATPLTAPVPWCIELYIFLGQHRIRGEERRASWVKVYFSENLSQARELEGISSVIKPRRQNMGSNNLIFGMISNLLLYGEVDSSKTGRGWPHLRFKDVCKRHQGDEYGHWYREMERRRQILLILETTIYTEGSNEKRRKRGVAPGRNLIDGKKTAWRY